MLEELIEFKKSIEKKEDKSDVQRKFIKYCEKYNKKKDKEDKEINSYQGNLLEYIRYMNGSGDGK